jgi:hypothetical protein
MQELTGYSRKRNQSHAAKLRQIAEGSVDEIERKTLLRMADAWSQLANRMRELSNRRKDNH